MADTIPLHLLKFFRNIMTYLEKHPIHAMEGDTDAQLSCYGLGKNSSIGYDCVFHKSFSDFAG